MKAFESWEQVLAFAIGEEQAAAEFYTALAQRVAHPALREALLGFAAEERGHQAKLEGLGRGERLLIPAPVASLGLADYVVAATPTPTMLLPDALRLAMQKERAAYQLYSTLAAQSTDARIRELFLGLATEEAKHKLRFELEYDDQCRGEN
jgi:rubrerythrin